MRVIVGLLILFFTFLVSTDSIAQSVSDSTRNTKKKNKFTTIFYGPPGKAALYSLVLPGAGQIYNKRPIHAALAIGGEIGFLYYYLDALNGFRAADACYEEIVLNESPDYDKYCRFSPFTGANADDFSEDEAFQIRNIRQQMMERRIVFLVGFHILQTLEAFIDRHLLDFDTNDNLSLLHSPTQYDFKQYNPEITLISFTIPLN